MTEKLKCVRCGKKIKLAPDQCQLTNGILTGYCLDKSHRRVKLKLVNQITIRNGRPNEEHVMRDLKCVLCGIKLWFSKSGSKVSTKRISGWCRKHKMEVIIQAKLVNYPDCDEIMEVKIKQRVDLLSTL